MEAAINEVYRQRQNLSIVALTGPTWSGCSTAASILSSRDRPSTTDDSESRDPEEPYRRRIIKHYVEQRDWQPFFLIKASDIILSFILEASKDALRGHLQERSYDSTILDLLQECGNYDHLHAEATRFAAQLRSEDPEVATVEQFIQNTLPGFALSIKTACAKDVRTEALQAFGDIIRLHGKAVPAKGDIEDESNVCAIASRIQKVVEVLRGGDRCQRFVIDALRSPAEVLYFRERYAGFYLFSIQCRKEELRERRDNDSVAADVAKRILSKEAPPDPYADVASFASQSIPACRQLADVHIENRTESANPNRPRELSDQLAKYVSLIGHPGLVTPTRDERYMEVALAAKLSSGCISRQVGAVVTSQDGHVLAIGWNDVPQEQIGCLLRRTCDLRTPTREYEGAYSDYELTDVKFKERVTQLFPAELSNSDGLNPSYCFKDVENKLEGSNRSKKNQVHTRSLHAEENAFLQLAKYGGVGVHNGELYTTDFPCELCCKKALQLGIRRIVYIEPYTDLGLRHVLAYKNSKCKTPSLDLFKGATGQAYYRLYRPFLAYKDELQARYPEATRKEEVPSGEPSGAAP